MNNRIADFLLENFFSLVGGFFLVCLLGMLLLGAELASKKEEFFDECLQYHKQYECVAMWRAGRERTTIIPMYVR